MIIDASAKSFKVYREALGAPIHHAHGDGVGFARLNDLADASTTYVYEIMAIYNSIQEGYPHEHSINQSSNRGSNRDF